MRKLQFCVLVLLVLVPLGCENGTSVNDRPFHITLVFDEQVPSWWRSAFVSAAERWEQIVRHELPEAMLNVPAGDFPLFHGLEETPAIVGPERGTRVYVRTFSSASTYPVAIGAPVLQRSLPSPTTTLGIISVNSFVQEKDMDPRFLRSTAVHELGHTLGLCAFVQGVEPSWVDGKRGITKGKFTLEGYQKEFNAVVDNLDFNNGNHWSFVGDVMSVAGSQSRITYVSIGALMDLGYPAVWEGAGRI